MPANPCRHLCINAGDGLSHVRVWRVGGICAACHGRRGSGNRATRPGIEIAAVSGMSQRLGSFVLQRASECQFISYLRRVCRRVCTGLPQATLVEVCCYGDSTLAAENAAVGGASLRIIMPSEEYPATSVPATLAAGRIVNWACDVGTQTGISDLNKYLVSLQPVAGTGIVHAHFSPCCRGTTRMNHNINKRRLKKATKRYHGHLRANISKLRAVVPSYLRGASAVPGHGRYPKYRTASSEQPAGARMHGVYPWMSTRNRRKSLYTTVGACMCGMQHEKEPVCKLYCIQATSPYVTALLCHVQCLCEESGSLLRGRDFLRNTDRYPTGLCCLIVAGIRLHAAHV